MATETEKTFRDLEVDIEILLKALRLQYKSFFFMKHLPKCYLIEEFNIIVLGLGQAQKHEMSELFKMKFPKHTVFYIYTSDKLPIKRYKLIWELMRSGYMYYLRSNYPTQIQGLLQQNNLAERIIKERLRIWGDSPRYAYLVNLNKEALNYTPAVVLSREPGFYDYMPDGGTEDVQQ